MAKTNQSQQPYRTLAITRFSLLCWEWIPIMLTKSKNNQFTQLFLETILHLTLFGSSYLDAPRLPCCTNMFHTYLWKKLILSFSSLTLVLPWEITISYSPPYLTSNINPSSHKCSKCLLKEVHLRYMALFGGYFSYCLNRQFPNVKKIDISKGLYSSYYIIQSQTKYHQYLFNSNILLLFMWYDRA